MPTWHNAGCKETQLGHFILRRGIAELRRRIFSALNTAWMPVGSDLCGYPVTIGASLTHVGANRGQRELYAS